MINNIKKITWIISFPVMFLILSLAIDNFKADEVGFESILPVFYLFNALIGMSLMFIGGLNLKKHAENPYQYPLSKSLMFLAAGSILFGLSSLSNVTSEVCFGCGEETFSDEGFDTMSIN